METSKKILLIEDEAAISNVLREKLNHEGFNIISAVNGEEGLSIALKEHPDLILLDLMMPKMNGTEMLRKLREDSWGKNVVVMILTNFSDMEKMAEAVEQGSYDFLVKGDWKMEEIVTKIKKRLGME